MEEKMTIGKAIKILRGFHQKDCYEETPLYSAIPFIILYIRETEHQLQQYKQQIDEAIKIIRENNLWHDNGKTDEDWVNDVLSKLKGDEE